MTLLILEATDHMRDGLGFANVREKLVAQPLSPGSALHQSRDIDEFHDRRYHTFGRGERQLEDLRTMTRVRDRHDAHIRLDRCRTGKFSASAPAHVMALNSVDLPTFGKPTMPHRKPTHYSVSGLGA